MAFGHGVEARTLNRRRVGVSCEGQAMTYTCAALTVHVETLYLCSFRLGARGRNGESRKPVELLHLTATSDERPHV
jgi:hypothetical protein